MPALRRAWIPDVARLKEPGIPRMESCVVGVAASRLTLALEMPALARSCAIVLLMSVPLVAMAAWIPLLVVWVMMGRMSFLASGSPPENTRMGFQLLLAIGLIRSSVASLVDSSCESGVEVVRRQWEQLRLQATVVSQNMSLGCAGFEGVALGCVIVFGVLPRDG